MSTCCTGPICLTFCSLFWCKVFYKLSVWFVMFHSVSIYYLYRVALFSHCANGSCYYVKQEEILCISHNALYPMKILYKCLVHMIKGLSQNIVWQPHSQHFTNLTFLEYRPHFLPQCSTVTAYWLRIVDWLCGLFVMHHIPKIRMSFVSWSMFYHYQLAVRTWSPDKKNSNGSNELWEVHYYLLFC